MNDRGANGILSSKVKLGADASAAAGPVGRNASNLRSEGSRQGNRPLGNWRNPHASPATDLDSERKNPEATERRKTGYLLTSSEGSKLELFERYGIQHEPVNSVNFTGGTETATATQEPLID